MASKYVCMYMMRIKLAKYSSKSQLFTFYVVLCMECEFLYQNPFYNTVKICFRCYQNDTTLFITSITLQVQRSAPWHLFFEL